MKRVLLIEDLPQVAQHLQSMLAREKEIEVAGVQSDPAAAITQIATEKPDIVMLDAFLGGKQDFSIALDVAKRIRAASAGTRIIVVTVPQKGLDPKAEATVDAVFVLPGGANELAQVLGVGRAARRSSICLPLARCARRSPRSYGRDHQACTSFSRRAKRRKSISSRAATSAAP